MDLTYYNPRKKLKKRKKILSKKKNPAYLPEPLQTAQRVRPVYYKKGDKYYRTPLKQIEEIQKKSIELKKGEGEAKKKLKTLLKFFEKKKGGETMKKRVRRNPYNPHNPSILSVENIIHNVGSTAVGMLAGIMLPKALKITGINRYLVQGGLALGISTLGKNILGKKLADNIGFGSALALVLSVLNDTIMKNAITLSDTVDEISQNEITIIPEKEIQAIEQEEIPEIAQEETPEIATTEYVESEPAEYISQEEIEEEDIIL